MIQKYFYAPIGVAVALVMVIFVIPEITKTGYALEVDAIKDNVDVAGIQSRVKLTNIGYLPLTNLIIDFDGGDIQKLSLLKPGQIILISPKPDTTLVMVKVTTDEGITITKEFRMLSEIPGLPHGIR
ncbi:MAG: hypothetical protein ACE5J2_02635 [Nitrososphaerales archaeon]